MAAYLTDGRLGLDSFAPDRLARPEVEALARRVTWRIVPSAVPAADAPGRIRITLAAGTVVEDAVDRSGGGPDHPLTLDQVRAKAVENGGEPAAATADLLVRLDELGSVDPVLAATRHPA